MSGPGCGLTCSFDADLHVRVGARATTSAYDCRPYANGNSESCTLSASGDHVSIMVNAYSGSGTVTITADHNGGSTPPPPPTNNDPTASFSHACSHLSCSFDASASSDPDGDSLSYAWTFGDGATANGVAPSHTYAAAGTYTVTLSVSDGNGGSDQHSASVTVTAPPPPATCSGGDGSVPTFTSGQTYSQAVSSGQWKYGKICVQAGATLDVDMTGPSCGLFGCSLDADLYVRGGAKPTSGAYDCRPYSQGNAESCTLTAATTQWYYVGVYGYSGSGTVQVTATA